MLARVPFSNASLCKSAIPTARLVPIFFHFVLLVLTPSFLIGLTISTCTQIPPTCRRHAKKTHQQLVKDLRKAAALAEAAEAAANAAAAAAEKTSDDSSETNSSSAAPKTAGSTPAKKSSVPKKASYDEKNIRRRVYDALNVLMAMDIITKDKKRISWRGWPGRQLFQGEGRSSGGGGGGGREEEGDRGSIGGGGGALINRQGTKDADAHRHGGTSTPNALRDEKKKRIEEIRRKRECLRELVVQNTCFKNLLEKNRRRELHPVGVGVGGGQHRGPGAAPNAEPMTEGGTTRSKGVEDVLGRELRGEERIPLPFIVVNARSDAIIQCEMSPSRTDVVFDFNMPFEINDDNEILKRLGMNWTTVPELHRTLPPDLLAYCHDNSLLDGVLVSANRAVRHRREDSQPQYQQKN